MIFNMVLLAALPTWATTVSVPLAWNPSPDPNVAGYKIYYGQASHVYTSSVDVGGVTNATITGLSAGLTYYFAATTYDATGLESDFSNEATTLTAASPTLGGLGNIAINENAAWQTVNLTGISLGTGQTLTITAVSSNPTLIPNPTVNYSSPAATGTLSFAPTTDTFGTATITVTVNNGLNQNNLFTQTFTITVNPVNQPPTLNPIGNLTLNYNSPAQTIGLSGISGGTGQTLTITAVSSNPALIPNPTVNYSSPAAIGNLSFTPTTDASGTATITVTVNNGLNQNNLFTQTFSVTVNPVNQPPTLGALGNLSINENAAWQTVNLTGISLGTGQTLAITAVSSNPTLIPNPTINYSSPAATGALSFAPTTNASGTATITVTVNNGLNQNNLFTQTFTVTVNPVNQPPTLNPLGNLTLNYNPPPQTIGLSGMSTGAANELQTLTVTAVSSNPKLIPNPAITYSSPLATGTLTLSPTANASGSSIITVTVNDGGTSNNIVKQSFTVTVKTKAASVPKPSVVSNASSQVILTGKTVTLKVGVNGTGPLKYQWQCNGRNVPGATSATLTLKKTTPKQSGLYTVTVSNSGGSTISTPVALTVLSTPAAILTSSTRGNGTFSFNIVGVTGSKYAVQTSADLIHWTTGQTNTSPFAFQDTNAATASQRFYRTVYVP